MLKKKAVGAGVSTKPSGTPAPEVPIPASIQPDIEAALDNWQEGEGDDEQCVVRGGLPYSRVPKEGTKRLVSAVTEVHGSRAVARRMETLRPALVELLRKTSLDDLDSVAMLEWLVKHGRFHFVVDAVPRKISKSIVPYSRELAFGVGDRVTHPKFGEGTVVRRLDHKVEVRFADAVRTLASG